MTNPALPAQPMDPPTLAMTFPEVNDSLLAGGTEGSKVTSRMIRDRLFREAEGNVALKVTESADKDAVEVAGRGELQLGILIEDHAARRASSSRSRARRCCSSATPPPATSWSRSRRW